MALTNKIYGMIRAKQNSTRILPHQERRHVGAGRDVMNPEQGDQKGWLLATGIASPVSPPPLDAERSRLVAIAMHGYHLQYLHRCYRLFDGDLLQAIVLGEIGLRHFSGVLTGANPHSLIQPLLDTLLREQIVNASTLSRATGIPRETVRRKIAALQQRGWLAATAAGRFRMNEQALEYFCHFFNVEMLKDFLDTAARLRTLVEMQNKPYLNE